MDGTGCFQCMAQIGIAAKLAINEEDIIIC
jgi:hypothetical protein